MPRVIFQESHDGKGRETEVVEKPATISFPAVEVKPRSNSLHTKSKKSDQSKILPELTVDSKKPPNKEVVEVVVSGDESEVSSVTSAGKTRRNVAETYRQSQRLSYDTVEYYENMNKALAMEAERAMNENKDLNLKIAELETKLVLVAGLIKEKQFQTQNKNQMLGGKEMGDKLRRLEESQRRLKDERLALLNQFESARDEMKGVLARNRELVDENEDLRSKLYHVNKRQEAKDEADKARLEEDERLRREHEENKMNQSTMVEVECVDANVGEPIETVDAEMVTEDAQLVDAHMNTTTVHTHNQATDTWALIECEEKEIMTEIVKPPENLQHAFIFPMFR